MIIGELDGASASIAYDQQPRTDVRYWIRNGVVVKQQFDVVSVGPGAESRTNDQRTTIDYFDIGTTTVTIPPAARAALGI